MNERIRELMLQAEYAAPEIAGRAQKFAELLIKECSKVCFDLQFTNEGPGEQAAYQRTLCGSAIEEHFGLRSKGPISAKNIL
jgi:hypothetical protein